MLVVAGLALFWGILLGAADALFVRHLHYATSSIAIVQAAASGLFTAAACGPPSLAAWGLGSLAARGTPAVRRRTVVLTVVQATAVCAPLVLIALVQLHKSLPESIPVVSKAGLALSAALVPPLFALGLALSWLAVRAISGIFGRLATAGYGLLAAALLIVGVGTPSATSPRSGRPNLLIITIDSLRRDTFDEYVERYASPVFRRFARDGRRYQNAHTTFSHSLPAHASMFTGLYPQANGATVFREANGSLIGSPLKPEARTLAEVLGENGYETIAILTNPWLGPPFGLERGFQTHVNDATTGAVGSFNLDLAATSSLFGPYLRYANRVFFDNAHVNSRLFLHWLRSRDRSRPFFAFLHYLDMHPPNVVERPYVERFCHGPYSKLDGRQIQIAVWSGRFSGDEMPGVREQVRNLYMAALARMDDFLSPVLKELEGAGWLDNTLVALVSDHGENLYEKVNSYEKEHVYHTSADIPLVLRVPGGAPGFDSRLASLIDISATFYAFSGVSAPAHIQGISLLPGAPRREGANDWVYVEGLDGGGHGHARAVLFADGHKYIRGATGREEVYDLRADPGEMHDLSAAGRISTAYRHSFEQIAASMDDGRNRAFGVEDLPKATVEQLKALGYVR
jgi:arylsulfatase A-like enzyme